MARKHKIIFILSSTRSGSTWLGYVLGSTPEAAFLGEYFRAWDANLGVPCSWCAANGVADCPVLTGVQEVPVEEAFAFAFARLHRRVLVDSSKTLAWAQRFVQEDSRYEIHLIHLIRDPRGWYVSERRRQQLDLAACLGWWTQQQKDIRSFLAESGVAHTTVFYDELAASPVREVAKLCQVLDIDFHSECLRYWQTPQHGFAANGASSLLLSRCRDSSKIVLTGDDRYYRAQQEQFFVDKRWQLTLAAEEGSSIEHHAGVSELLHAYGRRLSPEGISRLTAENPELARR